MRRFSLVIFSLIALNFAQAQSDTSLFRRVNKDTVKNALDMDALYNRPFLTMRKTPVSLGGYMEMNYQHLSTNRLTDSHEFQFRRLSLFVSSAIARHLKFLSEIEFEHDKNEELEGKPMEVEIEYASLDLELHPLLNLRTGIIVNPIGAFNQNHDGPKWEFTDRPIAMTQMLPETFSNTGAGIYGKHYKGSWMFGYEAYLTNGFNSSIVNNDHNKTWLPESNEDASRFSTSFSGLPLTTAKVDMRNTKVGELGFSWMGGVYNKWISDGVIIDNKRRCDVFDLDFNTSIKKTKTTFDGAWL